ncbi:hypothetical protein ANN_09668 [Periplaneta americana]|uniref:Uncharacterized protein n=1 Tax=Periplaneta americana TaxID=6978 RepID=A0ABQ8TP12_PERAM|nr:hypothetical protein ANN_09668 [Periplaneta americana]
MQEPLRIFDFRQSHSGNWIQEENFQENGHSGNVQEWRKANHYISIIPYEKLVARYLKNMRKDTKLKFYKVIAVPMLMYGAEFWVLNNTEERRIEAAEMRFLRDVAGYTLWDRKRIEDM